MARILLIVGGGIAAFKAAELIRLARRQGHSVTPVLTGGGAHFGGMGPMGKGYAAFVPVGRTFDPDTGQSWEGTGVAPDVAVPAEQALDEALKLAGVQGGAEAALASLKRRPVSLRDAALRCTHLDHGHPR